MNADKDNFREKLLAYLNQYLYDIQDSDGNWTVKGFIDVFKIKSTYRTSETTASGFTLGAFTGYFRNRTSKKNITFPYGEYKKHYVLGIIYTKQNERIDEYEIYSIAELKRILSVIKDIEFILQEKYRIATDRPWNSDSRDIASTTKIDELIEGSGVFAGYGVDVFDDYWMYYMTSEMAHQVDLPKPPYHNIKEYFEYKPAVYQRFTGNRKALVECVVEAP